MINQNKLLQKSAGLFIKISKNIIDLYVIYLVLYRTSLEKVTKNTNNEKKFKNSKKCC